METDGWGVGSVVWQHVSLASLVCVAGMAGVYGLWHCCHGQHFYGIS